MKIHKPIEEAAANDPVLGALGLRVPFVCTVEDALTPAECDALIARIDGSAPEVATINRGNGRMELDTSIRNNERVIFDDVPLAALLFERLRVAIPETFRDEGVAVGLNERFRCYRYSPGQYFAPHFDGCFARNEKEASAITVMVYLNEGCEGGETGFLDYETVIVPKRGMALLFQHQILHEGRRVQSGRKYVLRSDVMYRA